jgi:hypothetical protein
VLAALRIARGTVSNLALGAAPRSRGRRCEPRGSYRLGAGARASAPRGTAAGGWRGDLVACRIWPVRSPTRTIAS